MGIFGGEMVEFILGGVNHFLPGYILHHCDDGQVTILQLIAQILGKITSEIVQQMFLHGIGDADLNIWILKVDIPL